MDLWIRSQDKRILQKIDNIFTNANYDDKRICTICDNDVVELGQYKSKERALEVLNEIQNILKNNQYGYKVNGLGKKVDIIPNQIFVYEMPKE